MTDRARYILVTGAVLAMLAVILGAFGAHALKNILSGEMLTVYKTAVDYHFIHALGVLIVGTLMNQHPDSRLLAISAMAFVIGVLLFSGSLYTLSMTGILVFGAVTPFGGVAMIIGWFLLATGIYKA